MRSGVRKKAEGTEGPEISARLAGLDCRKVAQAESAEGARGRSCSEATYEGAPGALPEPPFSPCLPCILICLPE